MRAKELKQNGKYLGCLGLCPTLGTWRSLKEERVVIALKEAKANQGTEGKSQKECMIVWIQEIAAICEKCHSLALTKVGWKSQKNDFQEAVW